MKLLPYVLAAGVMLAMAAQSSPALAQTSYGLLDGGGTGRTVSLSQFCYARGASTTRGYAITVDVINRGSTPGASVDVSVTGPAQWTVGATDRSCSPVGGVLHCTLLDLAPGDSRTIDLGFQAPSVGSFSAVVGSPSTTACCAPSDDAVGVQLEAARECTASDPNAPAPYKQPSDPPSDGPNASCASGGARGSRGGEALGGVGGLLLVLGVACRRRARVLEG